MKYRLLAEITNPAIQPNVGAGLGIGAGTGKDVSIISIYLANFVKLSFIIGAIWAFFWFLMGAVEYIIAGGEKDKIAQARKRMVESITGLVILLCSYAIFRLINLIFGINLLNFNIPVI